MLEIAYPDICPTLVPVNQLIARSTSFATEVSHCEGRDDGTTTRVHPGILTLSARKLVLEGQSRRKSDLVSLTVDLAVDITQVLHFSDHVHSAWGAAGVKETLLYEQRPSHSHL